MKSSEFAGYVEPVVNNIKEIVNDVKKCIDYDEKIATGEDFSKKEIGILEHIEDYEENAFNIIESYFQGKHLECLVRHQTESYNHFVNYQIQRTIQMFNPVVIRSENDSLYAFNT